MPVPNANLRPFRLATLIMNDFRSKAVSGSMISQLNVHNINNLIRIGRKNTEIIRPIALMLRIPALFQTSEQCAFMIADYQRHLRLSISFSR